MCPANTTPDGGPSDENLNADASTNGGIPAIVFGDVQVSVEDRAPNYPPAEVIISVPMDGDPYIVEDGGLPDWLLLAAMMRIINVVNQAEQSDAWSVTFNNDDEGE